MKNEVPTAKLIIEVRISAGTIVKAVVISSAMSVMAGVAARLLEKRIRKLSRQMDKEAAERNWKEATGS